MISLVPEGTQIPGGYPSYGGQFGSYLAITYAIRDILTFIDVQDYNTPPLQGLDGEIYQAGHVDYHAAMTELLLHGFNVGSDASHFFPPLPAKQVAVGFLVGDVETSEVDRRWRTSSPARLRRARRVRLRKPGGYQEMIGAMSGRSTGTGGETTTFRTRWGRCCTGTPLPPLNRQNIDFAWVRLALLVQNIDSRGFRGQNIDSAMVMARDCCRGHRVFLAMNSLAN